MPGQIMRAVCRIKPWWSRMLAKTATKTAAAAAAKRYGGLPPASGAAAAASVARVAIAAGNSVNELIRRSALSAAGATSL